jgi:hypothetical protein
LGALCQSANVRFVVVSGKAAFGISASLAAAGSGMPRVPSRKGANGTLIYMMSSSKPPILYMFEMRETGAE